MLFILDRQYCTSSVSCCCYLDVSFKLQPADNWSSSNEKDNYQTSWSRCDQNMIIESSSVNHSNVP